MGIVGLDNNRCRKGFMALESSFKVNKIIMQFFKGNGSFMYRNGSNYFFEVRGETKENMDYKIIIGDGESIKERSLAMALID